MNVLHVFIGVCPNLQEWKVCRPERSQEENSLQEVCIARLLALFAQLPLLQRLVHLEM
jgi:hypothetical protein